MGKENAITKDQLLRSLVKLEKELNHSRDFVLSIVHYYHHGVVA